MSTTATTHTTDDREELFVLVATIAGLDAANDAHGFGVCSECRERPAADASGFCEGCGSELVPATVGNRCPGGCSAGLIEDPHGYSRHNPTGLRPCPVCG